MKKLQGKSSCSKKNIKFSEVLNIIKKYLIFILCGIYLVVILIFGLVFMLFQDGFVIGESLKADKVRKDYIEYMESDEELWYGIDLYWNGIKEDTIDDLLVEKNLFEEDLVYFRRDSKSQEVSLNFPSKYSLEPLDEDSKFSTYRFDDGIGDSLLHMISDDREITFSPDLKPIHSKMAVLYMKLIANNFLYYRIKDVYRGDYWLQEYEIKTNTIINEMEFKDVYYVTLEFMNDTSSTTMYLIIKDELLGDVYENIIKEKLDSGESYLIEENFCVETFTYISEPDGQEGSLDFYQDEAYFLYSLISSNAAYMGAPMLFEEKEMRLNYWDCIFISAMYATTTGYADVTISSNFLKVIAGVEAVVENGIILSMIVGLLTSVIDKRREN